LLHQSVGTPREEDSGYVGSFYIFGHAGCFGDEGHCDVPTGAADPFDQRLPHPLLPHTKTVEVSRFIREKLGEATNGEVTVTVVPVAYGWPVGQDGAAGEALLKFERLALVTYD
jgi:hypothetical protein